MVPKGEFVSILRAILESQSGKQELVGKFQKLVWSTHPRELQSREDEILRDLAYDLDFYEGDPKIRREDFSFYGDERLEAEIVAALEKLEPPKVND
jgi:hypothetical protein